MVPSTDEVERVGSRVWRKSCATVRGVKWEMWDQGRYYHVGSGSRLRGMFGHWLAEAEDGVWGCRAPVFSKMSRTASKYFIPVPCSGSRYPPSVHSFQA
jgi:hypothetical protein